MENETSLVPLLPELLVPSQDLVSFLQSCLPPSKSPVFTAFPKKKSCPPVLTVPLLCRVAFVIRGRIGL